MKSIKEIVMKESRPVYVHTPSKAIAQDFLRVAEEEGFRFGDGKLPTTMDSDDFFALHQDLTMNYIGWAGRMMWKSSQDNLVRLEYKDLFVD